MRHIASLALHMRHVAAVDIFIATCFTPLIAYYSKIKFQMHAAIGMQPGHMTDDAC